ncbi:helix-turn-helix transcriptional regulator [Rothia nasimurium]|uniref:helix-turn-helix transcriptional regulator n=1 Tax=Rothia nasimurium TaxID=85336 RepID=UPI001F2629EB|nr:helix-turn-helix transcriptional regulator [Rothia nasimurium]
MDDTQVGKNVARLRAPRNQTELAQAMREFKPDVYNWTQATVSAIEKGNRSLKLTEAMDVAEVLGVELEDLTSPASFQALQEVIDKETRALQDAFVQAKKAICKLYTVRFKYGLPVREAAQRRIHITESRGSIREYLDLDSFTETYRQAHLWAAIEEGITDRWTGEKIFENLEVSPNEDMIGEIQARQENEWREHLLLESIQDPDPTP